MTRRRAIQVVDLGFGDAGKGTIVDALVRRHAADLVVRFNGGPQAGHNVVTPDGRHHTFSQFGSGAFVPGVRTLLSRHMLIEPYAMLNEARHLAEIGVGDAFDRLTIDRRARVISPVQQVANRLREASRGKRPHGTCGMGVGECIADSIAAPHLTIQASDLNEAPRLRRVFRAQLDHKRIELREVLASINHDEVASLLDVFDDPDDWIDTAIETFRAIADRATFVEATDVIARATTTVFEGAQGILLDQSYGFHPHTTWSDTTFANADAVLDEAGFDGERARIGVTRCYATRHGPGPFVTEDATLRDRLPETHNDDAGWQGRFRVGHFDRVMLEYAIACAGGVDALAVTHLDRHAATGGRWCIAYESPSTHPRVIRDATGNPQILPGMAEDDSLTRWLVNARPVYSHAAPEDAAAFVIALGQFGDVAIESFGSTASDKRWRGDVV